MLFRSIKMRRMILIEASWPSNREAAVTKRTLLLGLYQVAFGRYGFISTTLPEGISVMKDKFYRFYLVEHPVMMILAIVFITLGYGMSKKVVPDEVKYKKAFIFFMIALLLILAGIPWQFREIVGRPYFPGV